MFPDEQMLLIEIVLSKELATKFPSLPIKQMFVINSLLGWIDLSRAPVWISKKFTSRPPINAARIVSSGSMTSLVTYPASTSNYLNILRFFTSKSWILFYVAIATHLSLLKDTIAVISSYRYILYYSPVDRVVTQIQPSISPLTKYDESDVISITQDNRLLSSNVILSVTSLNIVIFY